MLLTFPLLFLCGLGGLTGCDPVDPLQEIRQQLEKGEIEASREALRELLAEDPANAELSFLYGTILVGTGELGLAEWALHSAMQDAIWRKRAGLLLIQAREQAGNFTGSVEILDQLLEAEPGDVDLLSLRASANARTRRNYAKALEDAELALAARPEDLSALQARIMAMVGLDQIEEATQALEEMGSLVDEQSITGDPIAWHCVTTAIFSAEKGDAEGAGELHDACLEKFPSHGMAVNEGVRFFDARGDADRSLEILRAALVESPLSRNVRVSLAHRLTVRGAPEEALQLLLEATELGTEDSRAGAWLDVAKQQQSQADYRAGAISADRGVALARSAGQPTPQVLLEQAEALVLADRLGDALEVAERMTVVAHKELVKGRVFLARDQIEAARKHLDEGLRLWPNNAVARYISALAYERAGDFDRAVEEFRYSIRIDPGATDARIRLARLYLAEGRPYLSAQILFQETRKHPLDLNGDILAIELLATLNRSISDYPVPIGHMGRAVAAAADGVARRSGANPAARFIAEFTMIDLEAPENEEALRTYVRYAHRGDTLDAASQVVERALRAQPDAAALHQIRGYTLELGKAPSAQTRGAYARALELDEKHAEALAGLARLSAVEDWETSLNIYDRSIALEPTSEVQLAAAKLLLAAGESDRAQQRLLALIRERPYTPLPALLLAEVRLEAQALDSALRFARQAARFGGGAEAEDLLVRVHLARAEPELARAAERRATKLRSRSDRRAHPDS